MALTQEERDDIRRKKFALPKERKYPIHDERHATYALTMVQRHGSPEDQATVVSAVAKHWPGVASKSTFAQGFMNKTAMQYMNSEIQKIASENPGMLRQLWHSPMHSEAWEHVTDVGGLAAMGLASGSHLIGQVRHKYNPEAAESGPISDGGQAGMDLAGLTAMAVPTAAALAQYARGKGHTVGAGGGHKLTNVLNAAGLAGLMVPTIDKAQAHWRARNGEDPETKMLLGHKAHKALELGGYGALMGGTLTNPTNTTRDKAQLLAGYGALMAPQVAPIDGTARTATELAGLGMLAAPAVAALRHH